MLHLKIITPRKVVHEEEVKSVTLPSAEGEITILPKHVPLFSLLQEGILRYKGDGNDDYLAVGGGYVETDGKEVRVLVSRAYRQDEIDEKLTREAIENAKKLITESQDVSQRREASALLRRSLIDMRLIKRRRTTT